MKHLQKRRRKKPIWILYILALAALIMAGVALWTLFSERVPSDDPPTIGGDAVEGGDQTSGGTTQPDDGTTPPEGDGNTTTPDLPATSETIEQADALIAGYFYDEAIELLTPAAGDATVDAKLSEISALKDGLVKYEGQAYHVFFHSLIVDTAKAFDGDYQANGYNMYMTTVYEFQKMLPLFLENGFILYDITEMIELVDGKAVQKDIYLPEGKKPLIISIDDVNYYEYMKPDGFADRLDVDENGNVVTVVLDENGNDTITYDGDVMPILDSFVKEHPEFSWRGAKGIVAVTGYQGAFGYRITDLPDYDEQQQEWMLSQVVKVADALKASGWRIASHSYTHNQYWTNKTMTMDQLKYDTGRWLGEIMPYVGETNIIITPFGVTYDQNDERFRYIIDSGFNIYCPVGGGMNTYWQNDNMLQERLNLDGITMITYPERISKHFFDPALVLDPARPPLN